MSLFAELQRKMAARKLSRPPGEDVNTLVELEYRCWQLHWLLAEVVRKETEFRFIEGEFKRALAAGGQLEISVQVSAVHEKVQEINLLVEAFYLFAFRITEVAAKLPSLKFSAKGVRGVRNHLIVHPEKRMGKAEFGFSVGGLNGPEVRPVSSGPNEAFVDKGLWPNAHEFVTKFLAKAISSAVRTP